MWDLLQSPSLPPDGPSSLESRLRTPFSLFSSLNSYPWSNPSPGLLTLTYDESPLESLKPHWLSNRIIYVLTHLTSTSPLLLGLEMTRQDLHHTSPKRPAVVSTPFHLWLLRHLQQGYFLLSDFVISIFPVRSNFCQILNFNHLPILNPLSNWNYKITYRPTNTPRKLPRYPKSFSSSIIFLLLPKVQPEILNLM